MSSRRARLVHEHWIGTYLVVIGCCMDSPSLTICWPNKTISCLCSVKTIEAYIRNSWQVFEPTRKPWEYFCLNTESITTFHCCESKPIYRKNISFHLLLHGSCEPVWVQWTANIQYRSKFGPWDVSPSDIIPNENSSWGDLPIMTMWCDDSSRQRHFDARASRLKDVSRYNFRRWETSP